MAEQEVIKHTKAVYKAWKNPNISWQHKLKETFFEILIIVFAITLSLWLHNWSEKKHSREDARIFLQGLKTDLINDTVQLHSDLASYGRVLEGYSYFTKVADGELLNQDSLEKYEFTFYNTTRFTANLSRYEALKASGKLTIIEDAPLLNNIINYYQQTIPFLNMLNDNFTNYKTGKLGNILDEYIVHQTDGSSNWDTVLKMVPVKNALRRTNTISEIEDQYLYAIKQARQLLQQIEKEI